MLRFLSKLLLFLLLVASPYLYIQYKLMAANDAFYWKSTYKANTLILGGSRALKGLSPSVLKKELHLKGDILNFAFTATLSPYGELYYDLIKRKIKINNVDPNLFLLSVNPGNIMDFADANLPRESSFQFYHMYSVNSQPNIEYIFRHPRQGKALLTTMIYGEYHTRDGVKIYDDGYNATFLPDNYSYNHRASRENLIKYKLLKSLSREEYFEKTIDYLSKIGPVYLIRFPVSKQMCKEEQLIYPEFNNYMLQISNSYSNVYYLNYTSTDIDPDYTFSDGHHHLEGKSALRFTKSIADSIKTNL